MFRLFIIMRYYYCYYNLESKLQKNSSWYFSLASFERSFKGNKYQPQKKLFWKNILCRRYKLCIISDVPFRQYISKNVCVIRYQNFKVFPKTEPITRQRIRGTILLKSYTYEDIELDNNWIIAHALFHVKAKAQKRRNSPS